MAPFISPDEFELCLTTVAHAMGEALAADPRLGPRFTRSRMVMAEAEQELADNNLVGPAFKIANTALATASEFFMRTDPERARELLGIAVRLYNHRNPEKFASSLARCQELLAQLDALPSGGTPALAVQPPPQQPFRPAPAPTPVPAPAPAPFRKGSSQRSPPRRRSSPSRPSPRRPSPAPAPSVPAPAPKERARRPPGGAPPTTTVTTARVRA